MKKYKNMLPKRSMPLRGLKMHSKNFSIDPEFSDRYRQYSQILVTNLKLCKQYLTEFVHLLFGKSNYAPQAADITVGNKIETLKEEVRQAIHLCVRSAVRIITVIVLLFIVWGGLAPIESSVVAPGFIAVETNRKTVQHLEGGIIAEILVKEGDSVVQGQPLLYLNSTSANSQQQLILGQYITALASEARLVAERDSASSIIFPTELYEYPDQVKVIELTDGQSKLFITRGDSLKGKISILEEKISQFAQQIDSLEIQEQELGKQVSIVASQIKSAEELFNKGYGQKPKLLEYKNSFSALKGRQAELEAQISTTRGSISEAKFQIINERNAFLKEVMDELKDVQQKLSGFREQLQASKDVLERTVIAAPQSGKVTGLRQHTIGGVVGPGAPIMDIIPQNDKLRVEARVQLQDIDVVHEGLGAKVMLSAFRNRIAPRLQGTVKYVSADKFTDDKTGMQYYLAHVEINDADLKEVGAEVTLYPGMPAEVFITTGATTFLKYLLRPLTDSFYRSIRE